MPVLFVADSRVDRVPRQLAPLSAACETPGLAIDSIAFGHEPRRSHRPIGLVCFAVSLRCSCSFFVSFLYIGVYLFLNLYVAAIIDNFSSISGNDDGSNQAQPMRPSRHNTRIAGADSKARRPER